MRSTRSRSSASFVWFVTPIVALVAIVACTVLASAPLRAELGDVLHTIPCAGQNTSDLAWVEGHLYQVIFSPSEERNIYKLDPQTGTVLAILPYAGTSPQGLTYDGTSLWQGDIGGRTIYELDPANGDIRSQFAAPGTNPQPLGLGWDGASLWLADSRGPEKIWQLDRQGTVLGQFPAPGSSPYGLAWGAGFIWVSDNNLAGGALIYKLDPANGQIVASFVCPDQGGSPNGIAHDGDHLWIAVNTNDLIYEVDDGIASTAVAEETSWLPGGRGRGGVTIEAVSAQPERRAIDVAFALPAAGEVSLRLYSALGRQAGARASWRLRLGAGRHRAQLAPGRLAAGVYFLRLEAAGSRDVARVVWVR